MELITIITPTYNRANLLKNLYLSLNNQTCDNFLWLIIDDGSTDDTKMIIKTLQNENSMKIKYIYKKNGGKHTALNLAFENLDTELSIIVDSDDTLTNNAIEKIKNAYDKYKYNYLLSGFVFLKGFDEEKAVTDRFKYKESIQNYNEYIINKNFKGDKCEVFISNILKNYRFPVFKNEKFLGEGFLWSKISRKHDMVFIDDIIYLCNYLDDGLTNLGRKIRINNPKGGMEHAKEYLHKPYKFKVRIKNIILYITYSKFANYKFWNILKVEHYNFVVLISYIPSSLLYLIWKEKYK